MAITVKEEPGNIKVVQVSGMLKKAEWDAAQTEAAKRWESANDIKLLIVLDDFKGWERDDSWGNMDFYVKYGDKITKIAIVGDTKHEADLMMFSGAGFRSAPVKYYPPDQINLARKWLV